MEPTLSRNPSLSTGNLGMLTVMRDTEVKLVEMVQGLQGESSAWRAVHFHFSHLLEHYRSDYQVKIAVNLINDLLKTSQGGIYVCADSTIFVVCRNVTKAQLDKLIFQLRYLFMDDPLSYHGDGTENENFCQIFDLGVSWKEFLDICKRKFALAARATKSPITKQPEAENSGLPSFVTAKQDIKPLDPMQLANIERDLAKADLGKVLRRQAVCAVLPGTQARRVFDEIYINIAHLRSLLHVDVDLLGNRWLFKYLTQILDDRMLDLLRRNSARYFEMPVSLNLNVATLLSKNFTEFDAGIKPAMKVSIVIEIQVADIFTDMSAFLAAKDSVQKMGYRVCLDGLTNLSFTQVDRERLGFDLAKLQWNADFEGALQSQENKKLAEAIRQCGSNRVILCRCDSKQAIDYGQAMGISLFQGRYLDSLLNPASKIEN